MVTFVLFLTLLPLLTLTMPLNLTNCVNETVDLSFTMSTCDDFVIYWTTADGKYYISRIVETVTLATTLSGATNYCSALLPYLTLIYLVIYFTYLWMI